MTEILKELESARFSARPENSGVYIYIYIYIYVCVCVYIYIYMCVCVDDSWQFIYTILILARSGGNFRTATHETDSRVIAKMAAPTELFQILRICCFYTI